MQVHLVDGTYELYRQHYGQAGRGAEVGPRTATVGTLASTIALLADGATHIGVATDHVIESFRNDLWSGYKTSEGMEPILLEQIPVLEDALRELGVTVWAMERHEADDALASAASCAVVDERVRQVRLLTPDKDLGQVVDGDVVVQIDRRTGATIDEAAVREKFGVGPASIPDYLALVGDASDGFPGLPGWGAKSASVVLAHYVHLERIPDDHERWAADGVTVRGASRLAATLRDERATADLFKQLATLDRTVDVGTVDDWRWEGPLPGFAALAADLDAGFLMDRLARIAR